MKTIITTLATTFIICFILVCTGRINYVNAQDVIAKGEGSDLAIVETLHDYGFNLDWYESPTVTDYFLSNFRNTANKNVEQ